MQNHRTRMIERRKRQLARQPGFTPVRNRRIAGAVEALMLAIRLQNHTLSPVAAEDEAIRRVAATLPPPQMVKRWWRKRPVKNDDPAYRIGNRA